MRREIAKNYQQDYDVALDADDEVTCTIGSKEGIFHLCLTLIGPGDTVLVPAPAFPIHHNRPFICTRIIRPRAESEHAKSLPDS